MHEFRTICHIIFEGLILSHTLLVQLIVIYVINYSYTELEEKSVGLIESETKFLPKLSENLLQNDYYHHR